VLLFKSQGRIISCFSEQVDLRAILTPRRRQWNSWHTHFANHPSLCCLHVFEKVDQRAILIFRGRRWSSWHTHFGALSIWTISLCKCLAIFFACLTWNANCVYIYISRSHREMAVFLLQVLQT